MTAFPNLACLHRFALPVHFHGCRSHKQDVRVSPPVRMAPQVPRPETVRRDIRTVTTRGHFRPPG